MRAVLLFCSTASNTLPTMFSPSAPQHLRLRNKPSSTAAPATASDVLAENELRDDDAVALRPIGGPGAGQSVD